MNKEEFQEAKPIIRSVVALILFLKISPSPMERDGIKSDIESCHDIADAFIAELEVNIE